MTRSGCDDRSQSGSTAVEFALIAPVLLALVVGMLMLSIAYFQGASVQWALERSLRAAMIDPSMTANDIEALMHEQLVDKGPSDIDFSYVVDNDAAVPMATVTAAFEVPLNVPFLPDMALHFSAQNVAPVAQ